MNKDIRKIVKELKKQGWTVEPTRNGHLRAIPPVGEYVTLPGTPSDHRAVKNAIAALRKRGFVWQGR